MNKILVPVDFQQQSLLALEQSYNLARLLEAEVILLFVHEQSGIFAGIFSHEQHSDIMSRLEEKLSVLAGKVALQTGLKFIPRIESGRIYSKILEVAKETDTRYIIMGTQSSPEGEEVQKRVGANTSRVIRSAPCPVITISGKHLYNGCRNILLPLDLTTETRQKVTFGIKMAQLYNAGIKVVSALWSKNDPVIIGRLNQQIHQVVNFIEDAGIACTHEIVESNGGERTLVPSILEYAKRQGDIDLIIIMTQQEIGFVEFFVGSHAQEVIRLSDIPVMTIIPKELGYVSLFS